MDEQQLFALMSVAEQQQKAVSEALEGLVMERAALAQEREAVAQAAAQVAAVAKDVVPAVQAAAGAAVGASVRVSLAGASETAVQALGEAASPLLGRLSSAVDQAAAAEQELKKAAAWLSWKWVAVAAGGMASLCVMAYLALAVQVTQVARLQSEKAELREEVARLQAGVAELEKRGGRIVLSDCGGRLCVLANPDQGKGAERWQGAHWVQKTTREPMVIPKGY